VGILRQEDIEKLKKNDKIGILHHDFYREVTVIAVNNKPIFKGIQSGNSRC
jgi:hypothetical protein